MKKMTNTERIKSVVKSTLQMLFIVSIFGLFFIADKLLVFVDDPIKWDGYLYVTLYAILVSVVFGFLVDILVGMFNAAFEGTGVNDIQLPSLAEGLYIVNLSTVNGKTNKKIIIQ